MLQLSQQNIKDSKMKTSKALSIVLFIIGWSIAISPTIKIGIENEKYIWFIMVGTILMIISHALSI